MRIGLINLSTLPAVAFVVDACKAVAKSEGEGAQVGVSVGEGDCKLWGYTNARLKKKQDI